MYSVIFLNFIILLKCVYYLRYKDVFAVMEIKLKNGYYYTEKVSKLFVNTKNYFTIVYIKSEYLTIYVLALFTFISASLLQTFPPFFQTK